ncbi:MAG TPA: type I-C CRISPR-associated protein Cas7/Csd2 [Solidesulfovibrio sp.]|nr:type I-C CRISPR-associated protein Cas7/Csd2 [Desulfovibrio sp.]HML59367.1 type I-C CRISPR-associated protein Cas7/Csd2 [Solidesulfovibrio sp.]
MSLRHKIDFAVILTVNRANPNGDPLNGNRPRTDYNGYGEISDVCIKRKIRDRLMELGQGVFVQSDDRKLDGMASLKARAESAEHGLGKDAFNPKKSSKEETAQKACAKWFDVRAFGQLFAFKAEGGQKKKKEDEEADEKSGSVSIGIRGPVSLHSAFSVKPVSVASIQITKSVSSEGDGSKRGSDTMGMKHRVDKGVYVFYGSINPQLAERTGFSDEDALVLKAILPRLFENDASSARPEGSMAVNHVLWWEHANKSGQYSSARVHRSLTVNADGNYALDDKATPGLKAEAIAGF